MSKDRKENGLCDDCGVIKDTKTIYCLACKERRKVLKQKRVEADPEKYKKLQRENMRRHREKCFEKRLCWKCGKNPCAENKKQCQLCLKKRRGEGKRRHKVRNSNGLCKFCGKKPFHAKNGSCSECFLKKMASKYLNDKNKWTNLQDIFLSQNGKCPFTGNKLTLGENASLDHIVPVSAGGISNIENFQWVYFGEDFDINMMKRNFSVDNFLEAVRQIYEHRFLPVVE